MFKHLLLFFSALGMLFLQQIAQADSLSTTEKQITQHITQHQNEQLLLLEKLVNINSNTTNVDGVHQVAAIFKSQLDQLGFKTQYQEEPASMHRATTLIAEHPGKTGKRILIIGHLDTVFAKDSLFNTFKRQGDNAIGPGVIDDKGGDVIILYALKDLYAAHALDNANITIVLTGDEEDSGKPASISRKPLFDAANHRDIALDFEWALTANTATIVRRGISQWTLEASGKEAHSSAIFQPTVGDGAIFEVVRILNTMRTRLQHQPYLSFNPGLILGGTYVDDDKNHAQATAFGKANVIAKTAIVKGDLRFLTSSQKIKAENQMLAITQQHLLGTTATLVFQDSIPAMPPTSNNRALLKTYSRASEDLGYGAIKPLDPSKRGAGDISYIAHLVSANLAGLGAVGTGAHSAKETLDIHSLAMQTQRAALLIYRLTR
jgi:glutamate carboxypeptidase